MKLRFVPLGVGDCTSQIFQELCRARTDGDERHIYFGDNISDMVEIAGAVDIDHQKVGKPISEAAFADSNSVGMVYPGMDCTVFDDACGPVLMGRTFKSGTHITHAEDEPADFGGALIERDVNVVLNALPTGFDEDVYHYARECMRASSEMGGGLVFINAMPTGFDEGWMEDFRKAGLHYVGRDFKTGATPFSKSVMRALYNMGVILNSYSQINRCNNSDFLNLSMGGGKEAKRSTKTKGSISVPYPRNIRDVHMDIIFDGNRAHGDSKVTTFEIKGSFPFGNRPFELRMEGLFDDKALFTDRFFKLCACLYKLEESGYFRCNPGGDMPHVSAYFTKDPTVHTTTDEEARERVEFAISHGFDTAEKERASIISSHAQGMDSLLSLENAAGFVREGMESDINCLGNGLLILGEQARLRDDYGEAMENFREAAVSFRKAGNVRMACEAYLRMAHTCEISGDFNKARKYLGEAEGLQPGEKRLSLRRGFIDCLSGSVDDAEKMFSSVVERSDGLTAGYGFRGLGEVCILKGDYSRAEKMLLEAKEHLRGTRGERWVNFYLGQIAAFNGNDTEAHGLFSKVSDFADSIGNRNGHANVNVARGLIASGADPELSEHLLMEALGTYRETGSRYGQCAAGMCLAGSNERGFRRRIERNGYGALRGAMRLYSGSGGFHPIVLA